MWIQRGHGWCAVPIFCNHFAELEIVLFEVELIINNAPLKYVYPNTKETCLSSNDLKFDRQLLYCSNTALTAVTDWWRNEYVVNVRHNEYQH